MKCIKCDESFTNTALNSNNRYGTKYKVLTEKLYDYLKEPNHSKNIKDYIIQNCICYKCFNEHYKNNTLQYFDINDACYFCWDKKRSSEKNNTLCCEKCQSYISQRDEIGLRRLFIDSQKSRNAKLFNNNDKFVYHDNDFKIDEGIELDVFMSMTLLNQSKTSVIALEIDSNYHATYPYEEEKLRSLRTQEFFKEQNIDCLYIRFGWCKGIDTNELQRNYIILMDWVMLKVLYPSLYGFIIVGYPTNCKRVTAFHRDWNLISSPFLCNNKRPYLDWDSNDNELNKYNPRRKIFDRIHVIYDNKRSLELFSDKTYRYFITNQFLQQFLNDGNINLEETLLLKDKFFIWDDDKIVKIKSIEPFEQVGICLKKFKISLEILDINEKEINEKTIEYSYCDIKSLRKKVDNFIERLNENNIVINKKYKINSFKQENKIILSDINKYETNIQDIFTNKLFSKVNDDDEDELINEISLDLYNTHINRNKRKKFVSSYTIKKRKKQEQIDQIIERYKRYINCKQCLNKQYRTKHLGEKNKGCYLYYANIDESSMSVSESEDDEIVSDSTTIINSHSRQVLTEFVVEPQLEELISEQPIQQVQTQLEELINEESIQQVERQTTSTSIRKSTRSTRMTQKMAELKNLQHDVDEEKAVKKKVKETAEPIYVSDNKFQDD